MGFKTDTSFLRFLSMGAVGVHQTMDQLRELGFHPIQLERYCGSNKIWATKVKRLRLPDLLCVNTGLRVEVRAKTDLKIRMSDAPQNPDRVWDAGLRDDDLVAFIACFEKNNGPQPAQHAVFFPVNALRDSVADSQLGPPKSASEGAERDRTWPAIVPSRDGTVLEVTGGKLVVEMRTDPGRPSRRQTYTLRGKSVYVSPGDTFFAEVSILAGAPPRLADLPSYLQRRYSPLDDLQSPHDVDRYAAVKSVRFRDDSRHLVVSALEALLGRENDDRVALEAAGSATFFGSNAGQERIAQFIWENTARPELRMEAVFILAELGANAFTRGQLNRIATDARFEGQEIRQAAVWAFGKAGLKCYEDLLPFIDDADENVALHAIAAFDQNTPRQVIDCLVRDLVAGNPRRAAAASETLRVVGSSDVLQALTDAANSSRPVSDWIIATLGRLPATLVRTHLHDAHLLERISPMLLLSEGANWLASEMITADIVFLRKQNLY